MTHLQEAYDEVATQASDIVRHAPLRVREGARDGAYVLVGLAALCGKQAGTAARMIAGAPGWLGRSIWQAPATARQALTSLRERGEGLVRGVRERQTVLEAEDRFSTAIRGVKGAATSARRAAVSSAEAVRDVAGDLGTATSPPSAGHSPPHSPYEERTYEELYDLAATRGVEGRSKMTKDELIAALRA